MQTYTIDRYKSRNIDIGEQPLPCEVCLYHLINGSTKWVNVINDIHHVTPSLRWNRTHKKDGSDLLWLCTTHHVLQHWDNWRKNIEKCLAIAEKMIKVYSELWHKEKLWELVEILHSNNMKWLKKRNLQQKKN